MTIAERLQGALELRGLTQSELADKLNTTQAAVSQWLSGKREPSRDKIRDISIVLDVPVGWLAYNDGPGPGLDLAAGRELYEEYAWVLRQEPPDRARIYGNPAVWSLSWKLDTFVREALQNANDEILDTSSGAKVEFRLIELRGKEKERFLNALQWEYRGDGSGLKGHVNAATKNDSKLGRVLQDGVRYIEDKNSSLLLLRVDDYGTRGLTGDEFGEGNFAALCRNTLHSDKQESGAAGSYGLGKAVFTRASRIATVLFHSHLSESQRTAPSGEARDIRVIGRTDLAFHQLGDTAYEGPGWFGRVEKTNKGQERAESVWNNTALINDLHLVRELPLPGTTIMVVGFHDPGADEEKEPEEVAVEIEKAVVSNFWPALNSGRLKVTISTYKGTERRMSRPVEAQDFQPEFTDMLRKLENNDLSEELAEEGDVVLRRIKLVVPERIAEDPHREMDHEAILLVRRESDDAHDTEYQNSIAYFRGPEMIVKYQSVGRVLGGVSFRAAVLAGDAAGEDISDRAAEQFLRTAEPPAHNDWTGTPQMRTDYKWWGAQAKIGRFFDLAKKSVTDLIRPTYVDLEEGPRALRELLRVIGAPVPMPTVPRVTVDRDASYVDDEGRWQIQASITLPDDNTWLVRPTLLFAAESGAPAAVDWVIEPLSGCEVMGDTLTVSSPDREASFRGVSNVESHPGPAEEAAVIVRLRNPNIKRSDS